MNNIISERLSDILYHITTLDKGKDIIDSGRFTLMYSKSVEKQYQKSDKVYYMSFARSTDNTYFLDVLGDSPMGAVFFEIDGRSLSSNFSGKQIDYFSSQKSFNSYKDETEDRLFSKKPYVENALKYIKKAVVVVNDRIGYEYYKGILDFITLCKNKGVTVEGVVMPEGEFPPKYKKYISNTGRKKYALPYPKLYKSVLNRIKTLRKGSDKEEEELSKRGSSTFDGRSGEEIQDTDLTRPYNKLSISLLTFLTTSSTFESQIDRFKKILEDNKEFQQTLNTTCEDVIQNGKLPSSIKNQVNNLLSTNKPVDAYIFLLQTAEHLSESGKGLLLQPLSTFISSFLIRNRQVINTLTRRFTYSTRISRSDYRYGKIKKVLRTLLRRLQSMYPSEYRELDEKLYSYTSNAPTSVEVGPILQKMLKKKIGIS